MCGHRSLSYISMAFSVIVCYFCCTVDRENFVVKKFVCMAAIRNLNTQNNVTFENILYQKL